MASPSPALPEESSRAARLLKVALWAAALEGLVVSLALVVVFGKPPSEGAGLFGLAPVQLRIVGTTAALTAIFFWLSIKARLDRPWWIRAVALTRQIAARESTITLAMATFYASVWLCVIAFFGVSLRLNPDFDILLDMFLSRGLLPLVWVTLIGIQTAGVLLASSGTPGAHAKKVFLAGGILSGLLLLYWLGAEGQLLFYNIDMGLTDQSAYMEYARLLRESGYAYPGDFNRMPLYPFLLSLVLRPPMQDPEFFLAAKYFNLFLSIGLLAGMAVLLFRRYPPLHALNLIVIVAFTVFIYKAGWVQAELLFYFLNSCLFLLMWRLLERPSYPWAVAAGLVAGLAHLTKASIWPALMSFVFFGFLRGGVLWLQWRSSPEGRAPRETLVRALLVVPLAVAVFLTVISPYLGVSKRITGHAFYNVNSTFYVWYDSWEEAEAGTKAHGDRVGWPDMPSAEIPSLAKYVHEHTLDQMIQRVMDGGREVMTRVLQSYGYVDYLLIYGGVLVLAVGLKWRRAWEAISGNPLLFLFFVSYFKIYVLLYFWYAPIAAGDRLILAQFIPMLLVLASGVQTLLKEDKIRFPGGSMGWLSVFDLAVLALISVGTLRALAQGAYVLRGGG